MALPPLVTPEEFATYLSRENAVVEGDVDQALAVASEKIREAARSSISLLTSTVVLDAPDSRTLHLPGPVIDVASVAVDGAGAVDYLVTVEGVKLKTCWWSRMGYEVTVTFTHGYATIPSDVVDYACELAVTWLQHRAQGGGSTAGLTDVAIDDAKESYTPEAAGQITPVFIPEATRLNLARRFGGYGAAVTGVTR